MGRLVSAASLLRLLPCVMAALASVLLAALWFGPAAAAVHMETAGHASGSSGSGSSEHNEAGDAGRVPTMFEIAVERTRAAVSAGKIRDPSEKMPLGSLLESTYVSAAVEDADDADIHTSSEEWEKRHHQRRLLRRRLGTESWYSLGATASVSTGPSLADVNSTMFRYESVTPLSVVDWRRTQYMTPIQRQYACQSCWVMAALDTVSILAAMFVNKPPIPLSTQQVCDCANGNCCNGGWPEDAFAYIMANGVITSEDAYPYDPLASGSCVWNISYPIGAKVTGWELVPSYSQLSLMKAVTMQPVLVFISANSPDFLFYNSFNRINVYNGNCSADINHAVVVVGYNLTGGYWIIKNTWPRSWGDAGYMYIAMQDGAGKCGMLTINPMYPVYYPNGPEQVKVKKNTKKPTPTEMGGKWWKKWAAGKDPCANVVNPCGGGKCYQKDGIGRCNCKDIPGGGFVELIGAPTSMCVSMTPCTGLFNPCGAGACFDGKRDGTYSCDCSVEPGFILGSRADGEPTCVPANSTATTTYVTEYDDTCAGIQAAYGISEATFTALNPYLDCSTVLTPGIVVSLSTSTTAGCLTSYMVQWNDTCQTIVNSTNITMATLISLNPLVNCSELFTSQFICIKATTDALSTPGTLTTPYATCGQSYLTVFGDTCVRIMSLYGLNTNQLRRLNPGFNCPEKGTLPMGIQICVAAGMAVWDKSCSDWVKVQHGDTCPTIWNAYNLTQAIFFALNPGVRCQVPYLQVGQKLCVASPIVAVLANLSTINIPYLVQPNDTLAYISSLFVNRCSRVSITPGVIAATNLIENITAPLVVNSTLNIPCLPRVGANCGCTQSLPVCGSDYVTYQSFCDAQCNYALPIIQGTCDACRSACIGRAGLAPDPPSACVGYSGFETVCPYPTWQPPPAEAAQVVGSIAAPSCRYFNTTCDNMCKTVASKLGGDTLTKSANYQVCYRNCYCCARVPCAGPTCTLPPAASINTCTSGGDCNSLTGICNKFSNTTHTYLCQSCATKNNVMSCNVYCQAFATTPQV